MTPLTAPCRRVYYAAHSSGPRPRSSIQYEVVHCGESPTAESIARWFANSRSAGSTQRAVDDEECYRTLPDLEIPWGAPPLNTTGIHIELAGYSVWKPWKWRKHLRMLRRAGYKIALDCMRYKIPVRWLSARQLKKLGPMPGKGHGGITDHVSVSRAFRRTDHTDPGPGFFAASGGKGKKSPRALLMAYVRFYARRMR